ncbi:[4Fe-4S] proteins maturation, variant 2 [Batrachochytrium dendrobatidis]|nr:[4Fe-4S] proteins maturation [Batrachochytrium dendrobatidis]KAK5664969.1 [4Fe-4S] proteins maturation, variant 2 [Batrachochytrium dendrobatidis]
MIARQSLFTALASTHMDSLPTWIYSYSCNYSHSRQTAKSNYGSVSLQTSFTMQTGYRQTGGLLQKQNVLDLDAAMHSGIRSHHTVGKPHVAISEQAAKRIREINLNDQTDMALRVLVDSGGCHGFQYKLELTQESQPDDILFEKDGARVLVDAMSLDMLNGSTVDFVDELIGSSFQVVGNPNAETSCGCKTSFNLK